MFQDVSFSQPAAPAQKRTTSSLLTHFFIKQLNTIEKGLDGDYTFLGRAVDVVCIMGSLKNIETTSTTIRYLVADHTGEIETTHYITGAMETADGAEGDEASIVKAGVTVRVCGKLRAQDGTKMLAGLSIETVPDYHRVLHHRLSCIRDAAILEKISKGASMAVIMGNPSRELAASLAGQQDLGGSNSNVGAGSSFLFDDPIKNKIIGILGASSDPMGVNKQEIAKLLGPQVHVKVLTDALQFLADEGHIFTTITDHTYQITGR